MIEEAYVSFETAKLLKEKEFDEPTLGNYYIDGRFEESCMVNWNEHFKTPISAPTQQMAMRWLREMHHKYIIVNPICDFSGVVRYDYSIDCFVDSDRVSSVSVDIFDSYEQAVEAAIKYCLENLI